MSFKALIFDMDGVIINSEHLWRKAMIRGFGDFGMPVTDEECRRTMGMRFREVIAIWLRHFSKEDLDLAHVENHVLDLLIQLIESEGRYLPGIEETVAICQREQIPMGLATSSSVRLMDAILNKLDLRKSLKATTSAELLRYGKPHPEVFLKCAEELGVDAADCLVIEDSLNGVVGAKAARMQVVAVPDDEHTKMQQFAVADHKLNTMEELPALIRQLLFLG